MPSLTSLRDQNIGDKIDIFLSEKIARAFASFFSFQRDTSKKR